jgi:hypothetical protein
VRRLGHPATSLAAVTALIYVNQVLFTVYVLRVHHGDPSFIARYLPSGWFALDRGGAITTLARYFPAPGLLAPSVLRVQAFLELPFVIFAYLTVCRWFGVYDRARRLVWLACLVYTVTFCIIEWKLRNPYTTDDLVIRAVSGLVVPLWAARLPTAPPESRGLLASAASTAALCWLILVVYDTALLYNLGQLGAQLPGAALAAAALLLARVAAARRPARTPGRGLDSIGRSFGWFLVLFFVPALPVRYAMNFGWRDVTALVSLVVLATAWGLGARDAFARTHGRPWPWLAQMAASALAGLAAAIPAALLTTGLRETRLLWAAAAFFVTAVAVCGLMDRIFQPNNQNDIAFTSD